MEKTLRMSLLFDFYGPLLTERQQDVFQRYFHEDLSLGEISEQLAVSRQAIYDILRRTGVILEEFEIKLTLLEKYQARQESYADLLLLVDELSSSKKEQSAIIAQLGDKIRQAQATH